LRTDLHLYTAGTAAAKDLPAISTAMLGAAALNPQGLLAIALSTDALRPVDTFPFPITEKVLKHGMHRYLIYCVVCHDPLGTGHGKIVERGYTRPPSFHIERLRTVPVGHLFAVMSEGYGSMPSYAEQIPVRDRWAIAAYVRALQLSQHFPADQLPGDLKQAMDERKTPVAAGGGR